MPARLIRGLHHVGHAPGGDGKDCPLRLWRMQREDALWWDEHVQPWIDEVSDRADNGWNWPRIFSVTRLAGEAIGQVPAAFVAGVECASGEVIPCVMNLLVERYPDLQNHHIDSVFLWYLSPAPTRFFTAGAGQKIGTIPKALMAIGMDMTITHSYNLMRRGRVGLHASPKGGQALFDWYLNKLKGGGMNLLSRQKSLPIGFRWLAGNDGRYFFHDENSALDASRRMDALR